MSDQDQVLTDCHRKGKLHSAQSEHTFEKLSQYIVATLDLTSKLAVQEILAFTLAAIST